MGLGSLCVGLGVHSAHSLAPCPLRTIDKGGVWGRKYTNI